MAISNGSTTRVQFGTPVRGKEAATREAPGRACADPGCGTVLSTYNRSSTCYLHTAPSSKHPLHRG
jgi:hypothetical protein